MLPPNLMEIRFTYELKHDREHPISAYLSWQREEQKRRRAARRAALRARMLATLAALGQRLSTGVTWQQQAAAGECD